MRNNQSYGTPQPQQVFQPQVQPQPQEKKSKYKFEVGHDEEFDKAMNSINDLYSDMFSTSESKQNSGYDNTGLDDMYHEIMGTKSKKEEEKELEEKKRREYLKKQEEYQVNIKLFHYYQNNKNICIGEPVLYLPQQQQNFNYPSQQYYQQPYYPPQQQQMNYNYQYPPYQQQSGFQQQGPFPQQVPYVPQQGAPQKPNQPPYPQYPYKEDL